MAFTFLSDLENHPKHDMKRSLLTIAAILPLIILCSCKSDTSSVQAGNTSSFQLLQQKVFTPSCVGCHTQGTDYAVQSGLILDQDQSYNSLINIMSYYPKAKADDILLVKPGNADSSLLYMKVHGIPQNHDYGLLMPLGNEALSIGQQEFIKEWINAGAPKTGVVADASLLDDTTHYPAPTFTDLAPPAVGTGYQVTSGSFNVSSNFERELFVYRDLGNTLPIYVNRIHTKMRPFSHHLVLYTFDPQQTPKSMLPAFNVIRDLRNPDGSYNNSTEALMNYHTFLGGSMIQEDEYNFPPGVALKLPAHAGIDFNTHFVNYTPNTIPGECYANIYTTDASKVQYEAQPLFIPNTDITLPAQQQTTLMQTTTNPFTNKMNVFMLTSHYHAKGQKFQILINGGSRNGEVVYESTDWAHPTEKVYDPPIVLNPGEGLTTRVTYYNNSSNTIYFGLKSTDEMDVMYGYFYNSN